MDAGASHRLRARLWAVSLPKTQGGPLIEAARPVWASLRPQTQDHLLLWPSSSTAPVQPRKGLPSALELELPSVLHPAHPARPANKPGRSDTQYQPLTPVESWPAGLIGGVATARGSCHRPGRIRLSCSNQRLCPEHGCRSWRVCWQFYTYTPHNL